MFSQEKVGSAVLEGLCQIRLRISPGALDKHAEISSLPVATICLHVLLVAGGSHREPSQPRLDAVEPARKGSLTLDRGGI